MKKRILLALVAILIITVLSGCQAGSGISQAQYDQLNAQLTDAQSRLTKAQTDLTKAQADKAAVDTQLKSAQSQIAALQSQTSQSSLTGATPAETAVKIVKFYSDSHVYSTYDLYICSDMASDVWNMLKKQNISAVIVIGNKDALISDILDSNHAWVLAAVGANETLALETTGGYAVKRTEGTGGLYYVGWAFKTPADLKANNDWIKEVNIRINLRNQLASEENKALSNPALYAKLGELRAAQETEIFKLKANIKALATQLY